MVNSTKEITFDIQDLPKLETWTPKTL